ncbi:MAG: cupin domain-containing protein [Sphingobium sp.]|nr:cupin domain-containing protein [Sphingobium sp.]
MKTFTSAAVSPAGHGTPAMAFGEHAIRIRAAETGGAFGVFEGIIPPGEGPPAHVHEREDEFIRVIAGRFGFWCADDYVELAEGGCIAMPRGVPHRFRNIGETQGRLMAVSSPGGFEDFFATAERCQAETPEQIAAIAAGFGVRFLPDDERQAA